MARTRTTTIRPRLEALRLVFAVAAWAAATATTAAASLLSPPDYFGGQDNQAYLDWISESPISEWTSTTYVASSADPALGAAVHWSIDNSTQTLELAVATKSTGWLAFGMSVAGGMLGADIFVVEATNLTEIKDLHVLDARLPLLDECQNWKLIDAQLSSDDDDDGGFFMVRVRRLLDTGDPQDLVVQNDANYSFPISRVIAAWGDETTYGYHGANRAHSGIRWYSDGESEADLFKAYMETASDASYLVAASNYSVTTNETEYAYFCSRSSDMASEGVDMNGNGVTIVGFEPIIDQIRHVHHFILYASSQDLDATTECSRGALLSLEIIYLWGPGEPPYIFPEDVGMPLGGGGTNGTLSAYRTFVLEIHYDNPDGIPNQVDSSGVRTYYSKTKRLHEAGIFSVGDPYVLLREQPIEAGLTSYRFECSDACSTVMLSDGQPVTVLREYLHMHQSGLAMYNEHVRDGQVIRTGFVDFFEFSMNGGPAVPQNSFEIMPGDAFNVQCYYQNDDSANRTFGLASSQEMCVAFLLYYPRKVLQLSEDLSLGWLCSVGYADYGFQQCDAPVSFETLGDGSAPDRRTFGSAAEQCSTEAEEPSPGDGNTNTTTTTGPGGTSAGTASRFFVGVVHQIAVGAGLVAVARHVFG